MLITSERPMPPMTLLESTGASQFVPAPEVEAWARAIFIEDGGALNNPEHAHLRSADIGMLWTNADNVRRGRTVLGQCETGQPSGPMGKWGKARAEQQIVEWFGAVPDFIITISAGFAASCSDATFCALIEHELLHAGQERDEFGAPRFSKMTGRPIFGMRSHDIEEFFSVAQRYGQPPAAWPNCWTRPGRPDGCQLKSLLPADVSRSRGLTRP